jgi:hypothetical protein
MPFDVNGAINAGYTPAEIADHLGEEKKFDVAGARASGYTNDEIISHLSEIKKETGLFGSLKKGAEQLVSTGQTAVESLYKTPEEAATRALKRQEDIESKYGPSAGLEDVTKAYKEKGIGAAALETVKQIPHAIAEQAPNLATTIGGGAAGAAAGSVFGPLGTVLGGIAGVAVPSFVQQYGGNIEEQAQVQKEQGKPLDINRGKAAGAAALQTPLDVAEAFIPFGGKIAGKVFGPTVGKLLGAGEGAVAEKLAKESLLATVAKGTATGIAAEVPAEVTQQMLQRAQAGQSLLDEDAMHDYGATAFAVSLLGPLGIAGRLSNKADAGRQLAEAQQKASTSNEPVEVDLDVIPSGPPQLTYDPNVPTTRGKETMIVFPDGRVAPSDEAAFNERYKTRSTIPTTEEEAQTKPLVEPVANTQTVAMIQPDGTVKTFEGIPNKNGTGINLLDENKKIIKTVKADNKSVIINPTDRDIFHLETNALEKDLPKMRQDLEAAKVEANKADQVFKKFLKDHPLQSQYYSDIINPKASRTKALTDNQRKGIFVNSTTSGYHIDDLADIAHKAGFLSDEEFYNPNDNGGVNAFIDKVALVHSGESVDTPHSADAKSKYQSLNNAYSQRDDEILASDWGRWELHIKAKLGIAEHDDASQIVVGHGAGSRSIPTSSGVA